MSSGLKQYGFTEYPRYERYYSHFGKKERDRIGRLNAEQGAQTEFDDNRIRMDVVLEALRLYRTRRTLNTEK
ncbi:MAG: hypothetical protein KAW14_04450 [Candidatus Aegiribacteria sp.]|nr:hypothetical protein [Candidatus Aegiribacteria sp.]